MRVLFLIFTLSSCASYNKKISVPDLRENAVKLAGVAYLKGCVDATEKTKVTGERFKKCKEKAEKYKEEIKPILFN